MSDELTDLQRRFLANAKITPQRVTSREGRAAVDDLVARKFGYVTRCRCGCSCAICSAGSLTDDGTLDDDVRLFFHVPGTSRPSLPRRGDEDLREATDAPVFLVQRRRLVVTESAFLEWTEDGGLLDQDGNSMSDEKVVAHGWGRWEWDTQRVAFTRAEGQAYAENRAHDGPFRVWSVPSMGELRKILRALTDYDRPRVDFEGPSWLFVRYICDLVGGTQAEDVHPQDLQDLLTEIHVVCMGVDPTLDPDDLRYDRSDRPSLLREGADLVAELAKREDDLAARARAFLERANVLLHPRLLCQEDEDVE